MRIQEGKAALFLVNFAVKYFPKDMHSNKLNGIVYFSFTFTFYGNFLPNKSHSQLSS